MTLNTPVFDLFMVGPAYVNRLKFLGIKTIGNLLYHLPFRYDDFSLISPIAKIQINQPTTARGEVMEIKNDYTHRRRTIQKATIRDETGNLSVVWFNQPFLTRIIKKGDTVNLSGKIDLWGNRPAMISPEYELVKNDLPSRHTGRLVPVYHETAGLSSKWLRSRIANILENQALSLEEPLPPEIVKANELMPFTKAIKEIHFPTNFLSAEEAKRRFAFEELFLIQLMAINRRLKREKAKPRLIVNQPESLEALVANLPFKLTNAQERCLKEIIADLTGKKPMNRLLQGDVGSGKTILAAIAIYLCHLNGLQSALMAPTEILVQQHFQTITQLLSPKGVRVCLLTGSQKKTPEEFDVIIGTHALISRKVPFSRLGLVIIDEQQRFGVIQRASLLKKTAIPHFLTMTATPIPRTIALTVYGDLDISTIDEMPLDRKPIKTWVVPTQKRNAAYGWLRDQIKNNKTQVFIVCPLIEESETETMKSVKAAKNELENLKLIFPNFRLGLLHGRMKSKEKEIIIEKFRNRKTDILVATPVVEVGIDIPGADIMVIEGAERFGLAQLHQLRGRVGRREKQAYCLIFATDAGDNQKGYRRLKILEKTSLGVELAEQDLRTRGPGEIYGTRQHGFVTLKIANLSDQKLISQTGIAAKLTTRQNPSLSRFPLLKEMVKKITIAQVSAD